MTPKGTSGAAAFPSTARSLALLAVLGVAACSSSKHPERSEYGLTYEERLNATDKIIRSSDYSMRSSFEKAIPKGSTGRKFQTPAYNTKEAAGLKPFSDAGSTYRSKEFAESDKKERTEAKRFGVKAAREKEEKSSLASRLFRTPDNRFEAKASREAGKTFGQGDKTFATRKDPDASKELEKDRKPLIIEDEKPSYSEGDVKRLLNKG